MLQCQNVRYICLTTINFFLFRLRISHNIPDIKRSRKSKRELIIQISRSAFSQNLSHSSALQAFLSQSWIYKLFLMSSRILSVCAFKKSLKCNFLFLLLFPLSVNYSQEYEILKTKIFNQNTKLNNYYPSITNYFFILFLKFRYVLLRYFFFKSVSFFFIEYQWITPNSSRNKSIGFINTWYICVVNMTKIRWTNILVLLHQGARPVFGHVIDVSGNANMILIYEDVNENLKKKISVVYSNLYAMVIPSFNSLFLYF